MSSVRKLEDGKYYIGIGTKLLFDFNIKNNRVIRSEKDFYSYFAERILRNGDWDTAPGRKYLVLKDVSK